MPEPRATMLVVDDSADTLEVLRCLGNRQSLTSGTAALIRILRANLLDELNKPYVEAVCFDARFLCGDLREDNCIQCYSFL